MFTGYAFILCAALCWGFSATWARHLILSGQGDALLISQTRVLFAWAILCTGLIVTGPRSLRVSVKQLGRFAVLGLFGIAGANYFLYRAIGEMNAALADLIQFTAPVLVTVYMAARKEEPLDTAKVVSLVMATLGCALALGVTSLNIAAPPLALASAGLSAICFATTLVLGKHVSGSTPLPVYLHYALLSASVLWLVITPPWVLVSRIQNLQTFGILVLFSITSILMPYLFFFAGLRRIPASRASIASTFEPVVVAAASWMLLSERLSTVQVLGMVLVCAAIVLVEITSPRSAAPPADTAPPEPRYPSQTPPET